MGAGLSFLFFEDGRCNFLVLCNVRMPAQPCVLMRPAASPPPPCARLQEALRLQQLRHAHVVAFYGVALMGSKGLVLMEFCEGAQLYCLYCTVLRVLHWLHCTSLHCVLHCTVYRIHAAAAWLCSRHRAITCLPACQTAQ